MKWIVGVPAAVFAGVLTLAILGPKLVDWNTYRDVFEAEIARSSGYDAAIDGNIGATLLPTPRITIAAVRIGRDGAHIADIRWLEAKLRLSDIVRGSVQLVDLTLIEPSITIEPGGWGENPIGPVGPGWGRAAR